MLKLYRRNERQRALLKNLANIRLNSPVLKAYRKSRKESLRRVALNTGLAKSAIHDAEKGFHTPGSDTLLILMLYYNIRVEDILI